MMKGHYREVVGCSRKSPSTRFFTAGGRGRRKLIASLSPLLLIWQGNLKERSFRKGSIVIRWRLLFVMDAHALPT